MIAKSDSLHLAAGEDNTTFRTKPYNQEMGILGNPSILTFLKRMAFFSDDGIYVDTGDIPKEISEVIRPTIRRLNPANLITRGAPKQISVNNQYYKKLMFAVRQATGDGENDTILVYNWEIGSWTIYKGIEVTAMARVQIDTDWEYLFGGDSNGNVFIFTWPGSGYNYDSVGGSDNAIEAHAETVWMHLPRAVGINPWARAKTESAWLKIYAGGQPAAGNNYVNLQALLYTDFDRDTVRATYSLTFNAAAWPAETPIEAKLIESLGGDDLGPFEWLKLKFINNEFNEHFKIQKLVFGFRAKPSVEE